MTSKNVLKLNDLRSETDLINKKSGYDLIFLNDFTLQAYVGVYKHEKEKTQPIKINVIAKVRNPKRINDNNLQSVVCYNQISKKIKKIIKSGHTIILEKLAEKIFAIPNDTKPIYIAIEIKSYLNILNLFIY